MPILRIEMVITSAQNEKVKRIVSLHDKKGRRQCGTYLAEGKKLIREALALGLPVRALYAAEDAVEFFGEFDALPCAVTVLSRSVFDRASTERTPEGVMAEIALPSEELRLTGDVLLLDGVSDPGNLGTLIRTAAAAGYETVLAVETADAFSPKAVRAAMGGLFRVCVIPTTRENAIATLMDGDYKLIAADMDGEDAFAFTASGKICLAVGNEANGLSEEITKSATYTVKIPMQNGMESLNAAISGSILMYLLKRNK